MNDRVLEAEARVADGTRRLEDALASDSWCSIVEIPSELDWGCVMSGSGRVIRKLRGRKMRTWSALMDEFGAALQFGDYFGENGAALDECLSDLDWLPTEVGYVLIVVDPEQVLAEGAGGPRQDEQLGHLVRIFGTAVETFAEPIELGEDWDRPALAFDVVLVSDSEHHDDAVRLWTTAGALPRT